MPSYTASKSGVMGLTRELACEWAGQNINVNAIAPGYMATENTRALQEDPERSAEIMKRIPAARWGQPGDLAGAVVFLASDAASYIHGYTLAVERGKAIGLPEGRGYSSVTDMLDAERRRPDGAEVVAIMTPNDSHFVYAMAALDRDFHLICDKPMTNTLAEARQLHARVVEKGTVFCLTHNYTDYPMARQARAMVAAGELGTIRLVQVDGTGQPGRRQQT